MKILKNVLIRNGRIYNYHGTIVRISQTPASIGERVIALAIDLYSASDSIYFLLWPCFHGFIYL